MYYGKCMYYSSTKAFGIICKELAVTSWVPRAGTRVFLRSGSGSAIFAFIERLFRTHHSLGTKLDFQFWTATINGDLTFKSGNLIHSSITHC